MAELTAPDYGPAWRELQAYLAQAVSDGGTVTGAEVLAYMAELKRTHRREVDRALYVKASSLVGWRNGAGFILPPPLSVRHSTCLTTIQGRPDGDLWALARDIQRHTCDVHVPPPEGT